MMSEAEIELWFVSSWRLPLRQSKTDVGDMPQTVSRLVLPILKTTSSAALFHASGRGLGD
jgi:hypothetical protein